MSIAVTILRPAPVTATLVVENGETVTTTINRPPAFVTLIQAPGGGGGTFAWSFRTVAADTAAALSEALLVDATTGPVAVTLPAAAANGQITVIKTDSSTHPVTVIGFDPISTQNQSVTLVADGTTWRILMAYTPGLGTVVAQIAALKQQAVSARLTQAGSATPISAAFGTQYEITGSTNQTINLPASSTLPATSTGVVVVKCGPSYSGTITVSPASGTIDGAASFTLVGGGQENLFEVGTSDTDWQVG